MCYEFAKQVVYLGLCSVLLSDPAPEGLFYQKPEFHSPIWHWRLLAIPTVNHPPQPWAFFALPLSQIPISYKDHVATHSNVETPLALCTYLSSCRLYCLTHPLQNMFCEPGDLTTFKRLDPKTTTHLDHGMDAFYQDSCLYHWRTNCRRRPAIILRPYQTFSPCSTHSSAYDSQFRPNGSA